jgi:hypothetical protein
LGDDDAVKVIEAIVQKGKIMKPITERLVMARINRALLDGRQLHKCRPNSKMFGRCGSYCLQGADGIILQDHIDLEKLGRETGVIAEWERMTR